MRERAGACWVSQCLQCTPRLPPEHLWDTSLLPTYCVGTACTCFTPSFAFQRGPSQPNDHHLNKLRSNFVFSPAHVYQHPPFGRPSSALRTRKSLNQQPFWANQICTRKRKYAHAHVNMHTTRVHTHTDLLSTKAVLLAEKAGDLGLL